MTPEAPNEWLVEKGEMDPHSTPYIIPDVRLHNPLLHSVLILSPIVDPSPKLKETLQTLYGGPIPGTFMFVKGLAL